MANKSVSVASSLIGDAFESIDVEFSDSDSWQVIDSSDSDDGNFSYDDIITTDDDDDDEEEVAPDVDDLLQHSYGSPASDISIQSLVGEIPQNCQEVKDAHEIDHIRQMSSGGLIGGEDDPYEEDEDHTEKNDDGDEDDLDLDDELVQSQFSHRCQEMKSAHEIRQIIAGEDAVVDVGGLIEYEEDPYEVYEDHSDEDEDDDLDLDDELVPKWLNNKFERQRMRKLGKRVYPKMKKSKRLAYMYSKPGCVHGKHGLGTKHNLIW
ncbi:hypothetical protein R6Q59_019305 [Mikania micrantha]